ncbi:reticulon-like protein B17 isoform X2 [Helianthus annuus]|uniref:reticulon-like protein B17 isoform X2 n=1 Tax=Helianthus annuus TaxID=4232 RepID=UPI000B8F842D|nr:reticulon-like protein B17 isoform X2 [Helianthus annuus]
MVALVSQLGLLCLCVLFISNMIAQRNGIESKRELKLKEEDILRAARVILPAVNFAISKARKLFSGQPSTTLKVAPLLLPNMVILQHSRGFVHLDSLSALQAQNCTHCTQTKYARKHQQPQPFGILLPLKPEFLQHS